jgi:hypothetical protein
MAGAPDDVIDRLYGLPLDEFIAAREALSKELRSDGRRDEANGVKKLAKPTVAAWAVNQAVRSQGKAARALWKAGDDLAATQEAVLGGKGSGADLRAAADNERAALDPLVAAARGLLSGSGDELSETTIDRVRETLHAAAIDPEAREDVAAGRATRERAPRGLFGGGVAAPAAPRARARSEEEAPAEKPVARRRAAAPKPSAEDREAEAERKREAAAARKREREEAAAREKARKEAAVRVTRAERALATAAKRSADAAERLEAAQADEQAAAEALEQARAELQAAEQKG